MAARKAKRKPDGESTRKLTQKQQIFVDAYLGEARFNATEAARIAKYAYPNVEGPKNLVNPSIAAYISRHIADVVMDRNETLIELADHARASMADFITFREVREPVVVRRFVRDMLNDLLTEIQFEETFAARARLKDEALKDHRAMIAAMRQQALRLEMKLEMDPDAMQDVATTELRWRADIDLQKAEEKGKLHLLQSFNADTGRIELVSKQKALELIGKHHALFTEKVLHGGDVGVTFCAEQLAEAKAAAAAWEREQFGEVEA